MNINAISAAAPKFQTPKAVRNVNFTGLEKAAQNLGSTAGEAAANAAGKLGITEQITKILSFVLEGLKNLGQGILRGLKKLFNTDGININIGKNKTIHTVNGKRVSVDEFEDAFSGFNRTKGARAAERAEAFFSKAESTAKGSGMHGIVQQDGKTYIFGKLYKPGYKLPEGVVIGKNSLTITTKKPMAEFMEELKKISEEWE